MRLVYVNLGGRDGTLVPSPIVVRSRRRDNILREIWAQRLADLDTLTQEVDVAECAVLEGAPREFKVRYVVDGVGRSETWKESRRR